MGASVWYKESFYSIEFLEDGFYFVSEVDLNEIAKHENPNDYGSIKKLNKTTQNTSVNSALSAATIKVFVAYTSAVAQNYNIDNLVSDCELTTNRAFQNSLVSSSIDVVGYQQLTYTESGNDSIDVYRFMTKNDGYMDEIHSLRNQYDADVCVLLVNTLNSNGRAASIGSEFSDAFCVVKAEKAVSYYSFAHELGHLFGCRHDSDPDSEPYLFAHGYKWTFGKLDGQEGNFCTIMSTAQFDYGNKYTRKPYFSNPYVLDQLNNPMGTIDSNYCARAIDDYASYIAGFEPHHTTSGTIDADEWWQGTINITGNISVANGITLTVQPGTNIYFQNGVSFSIYGTLTASSATFQGNGSAGSWNSISFYSGSSGSIQGCTIKDAQCGIYATTGASINCSDNTITNNSLYGLSIINNSSVNISGSTISNNGTGINLSGSTAAISPNSIYNNSNYGIHAENVNANSPWENDTLINNSGYAMFLNNTSPILLHNMITGNGHGIIISSGDPSFGYRAGGSGYNAITCSSTPLFKAENYSDVYAGSDGGGYNSIFGSDLPDMEAVNNSSIVAENNYWGSPYPATYADGTSEISANNPLADDPNPGSSCMGKISASKDYAAILNVEDEDIPNLYHQAHSYGNKKDYKTAKDLLKSIINGKFDKKYSPLSLLSFYNFSIQEQQTKDSSSKSFEPTKDYVDLVQELYRRPASDSLRPFAVRLLARGAALTNNYTDMVKYNTEVVNNYPSSSNELAALYDLVSYYSQIENNPDLAVKYLTRMKAVYPDEDLTLFAQINMGEKVDIYNRPNKNKNSETVKSADQYLSEAYPNPFNPATTITYSLKERDQVTLKVYNVLGKEVAKLVEGIQSEGEHTVIFSGSNLPSGIYVYKLSGRNFSISKKMLLLK